MAICTFGLMDSAIQTRKTSGGRSHDDELALLQKRFKYVHVTDLPQVEHSQIVSSKPLQFSSKKLLSHRGSCKDEAIVSVMPPNNSPDGRWEATAKVKKINVWGQHFRSQLKSRCSMATRTAMTEL